VSSTHIVFPSSKLSWRTNRRAAAASARGPWPCSLHQGRWTDLAEKYHGVAREPPHSVYARDVPPSQRWSRILRRGMDRWYTYVVTARIIPERLRAVIGIDLQFPTLEYTNVVASRSQWTVRSTGGQIGVVVRLAEELEDLATFANEVVHILRYATDAIAFTDGVNADVDIISIVDTQTDRLLVLEPFFAEFVPNPQERTHDSSDVIMLSLNSSALRQALADFRDAFASAHNTPFFAFRAVECIRAEFEQGHANRKHAWRAMRDALGIGEDFLQPLVEASKRRRHGEFVFLTAKDRYVLLKSAWTVIDRYIAFLKRPVQPRNRH
jgi:hypothetical protein